MKRIIALTLVLTLLLCGCGSKADVPETTAAPTEAPVVTTEPAAEPTTEPTVEPETEPAPVYFNPLNGEILDEPFTGRIFANTISNIPDAIPHVGVNDADILMEMFVNGSIVRCLALFTDISDVESIGSTRSTRLMFNDIAQHYDAILSHAGGSDQALGDARDRGIDNFNIDAWAVASTGASFRDEERNKNQGWEHCLMGIGSGIMAYAESQGVDLTQPADKDYCLTFTEDGTPADGETAEKITIDLTYNKAQKETIMEYDPSLGKYVYNQYGKAMADGTTGESEAFRNVIVMYTSIHMNGIYHEADFLAGGTGYFACGGKLVPITWTCDGDDVPFRFLTEDGEQLDLGMGNTYIAICTAESPVVWEAAAPAAETVAETTAE